MPGRKKVIKIYLLFFVLSLLLFYPLNQYFFRTNDLIGDISSLIYVKQTLFNYHGFPQWNPYINQGLSLVADPLSSYLNPFVLLPVIILPTQAAIPIIIFLSIFLSAVFFYMLLKLLKISDFNSVASPILYMTSGYLLARIVAGHLELIISYPLIPLFYFALIKLIRKKNYTNCFFLSLIISMFLFSGALYLFYYSLIVLSSLIVFEIVIYLINSHGKESNLFNSLWFFSSIIITILISSVKLLPLLSSNGLFIKQLVPFLGSQNPASFIFNLFIPFGIVFIKLGLGKYILQPYPWWESFSFLGIVPLVGMVLFLFKYKKIKFLEKKYLVFILAVIILYLFIDNVWNPFYWIIKEVSIFQKFRIPSRFYIFLIPIILIFSSYGFDIYFRNKNNLKTFIIKIFILSGVIFSFISFFYIFEHRSFKPINDNYLELIKYLKNNDSKSDYYIAQNVLLENQLPQYKLVENYQKLLNSNYGYVLENSSTRDYILADFYRSENRKYFGIIPKYFIYPCSIRPIGIFKYDLIKENEYACLFKSKSYTPYIYYAKNDVEKNLTNISGAIKVNYSTGNNYIKINFNSKGNGYLKILESNYPGWKLKIDGRDAKLEKNDYLVAKVEKGQHEYLFYFNSMKFKIGLIISILVLFISVILIFKEKSSR